MATRLSIAVQNSAMVGARASEFLAEYAAQQKGHVFRWVVLVGGTNDMKQAMQKGTPLDLDDLMYGIAPVLS